MTGAGEPRWLLLLHQIPPRPSYLRVKTWRRLQALGAVAIKNSVYALPRSEGTQEDLEWVLREIVSGGGDGSVCEARFVDGLSDEQVEAMFHAARDADYAALAEEIQAVVKEVPPGRKLDDEARVGIQAGLTRARKRFAEIAAIDHLGAPGRANVEGLLGSLEKRLAVPAAPARPPLRAVDHRGRTWVTRKGIHIDRMASAWLIRRFIDPDARFRFVVARGHKPAPGELRFDMFQAEFTHEGDRCTFEVLLERFGLEEPALGHIAEIVHDLDVKDGKFARADALGVERLMSGIAAAHPDDEARLARASAVLDDLHACFRA